MKTDEPILEFCARWVRQRRRFAPGDSDCALFCAQWVDQNNSTNMTQRIGEAWGGARTVMRVMAEPGAFRRAIIGLVGEPTANVGEERGGDVVLMLNYEEKETLAIAGVGDFAYGLGPVGYAGVNRRDRVLAVWSLACLQ